MVGGSVGLGVWCVVDGLVGGEFVGLDVGGLGVGGLVGS